MSYKLPGVAWIILAATDHNVAYYKNLIFDCLKREPSVLDLVNLPIS